MTGITQMRGYKFGWVWSASREWTKAPRSESAARICPRKSPPKRGLWESYFLQGMIGKTHTQNLQILREDTLRATCSAGPFCLLPSIISPYSTGAVQIRVGLELAEVVSKSIQKGPTSVSAVVNQILDAAFLLTVGSFLLTGELFYLQLTSLVFFTYSWNFFAYNFSFFTYSWSFLLTVGKGA